MTACGYILGIRTGLATGDTWSMTGAEFIQIIAALLTKTCGLECPAWSKQIGYLYSRCQSETDFRFAARGAGYVSADSGSPRRSIQCRNVDVRYGHRSVPLGTPWKR